MKQEVAPPLAEGRYRLTGVLGVGGMAVVYRAHDVRLDVERAVKVLRPDLDDRARERFETEARTMAKLHHGNVVLIHDVAEDGDRAYLVMEFIDGGSIADRLHAYGALPPRMAAEVMIAMLSGLQAAHETGVVHRDVKPHNIMVAKNGVVKVTDFGIAQVSDMGSTKTGAAIGTWAYMAPEQRADSKHVDARADVFGAGCTLYKMLTNKEPFDLYNVELQEELFEGVPEAFHPIIKESTRYKAENRYVSCDVMREALLTLLPELPLDPDEVPPLGASIESERAAFAPTVFTAADVSNPTFAHPPQTFEEPERGFPFVLLGIAAVGVVMVLVGAGFGLMTVGGLFVAVQSGDPTDVLGPPVLAGPEAPDALTGDPSEAEGVEGQPEPDGAASDLDGAGPDPDGAGPDPDGPDPDGVETAGDEVGPDDVVTDPDPANESPEEDGVEPLPEPDVAPAEPTPAASTTQPRPLTRPEPEPVQREPVATPAESPKPTRYEPEPEPEADGHMFTVNTVPSGMACIHVGAEIKCDRTPFRLRLPEGAFTVEVSSDAGPDEDIPVRIPRDKQTCWDFRSGARCGG